jgi:hypothetical protein
MTTADKIRALAAIGRTPLEIARELGVSRQRVASALAHPKLKQPCESCGALPCHQRRAQP